MNPFLALLLSLWAIPVALIKLIVPTFLIAKKVDNDVVLITGGGGGLGRALGIRFAQHGTRKIVLWDLSDKLLEESSKAIEAHGAKCWTFNCDVTDRHKVYALIREINQTVGTISILVNNAGIVSGAKLLDIDDEKIIKSFEVNAISHFWTTKAVLPGMMSMAKGHIVSIASLAGMGGAPRLTDYCASKFAAVGFEESLRAELQDEGYPDIKSTVVCPFYINTGMFDGVQTGPLPLLDTDYVADKVMTAIVTDQEVLIVPRLFYFIMAAKGLVPAKSFWLVGHYVLKITECMKSYTGHRVLANNVNGKKAN